MEPVYKGTISGEQTLVRMDLPISFCCKRKVRQDKVCAPLNHVFICPETLDIKKKIWEADSGKNGNQWLCLIFVLGSRYANIKCVQL